MGHVKQAKILRSSPFKNIEKGLLKSYKRAYVFGLRTENCVIYQITEKYANYWQFKEKRTVHALYASDLNIVKGKKVPPHNDTSTYTDKNKHLRPNSITKEITTLL
jgi:hypothetical protein